MLQVLYGNKILRGWGIKGKEKGFVVKMKSPLEDHVHGTERVLNTEEATVVMNAEKRQTRWLVIWNRKGATIDRSKPSRAIASK